jgi:glycosylphosphatidylinositol transamidase (GPIT) subunit GPI8
MAFFRIIAITVVIAVTIAPSNADEYAVLVAGSRGYENYRHQADVCHYYHTLTRRGINASNIIVLMYDDVASDPLNPFPFSLFNQPTVVGDPGLNVRHGCMLDYTGNNVTAANFLSVITGNSAAVMGIGTGRVLTSSENDNVLIYFTDHGGTGVLQFPEGPFLEAPDLLNALDQMRQSRAYHRLILDIEACESGSMVEGLPSEWGIYSTTASSPTQSSWGTFCAPYDMVNGVEIGACLADSYSFALVSDMDDMPRSRTLLDQFIVVHNNVTSSNVSQWGDLSWTRLRASLFEGPTTKPPLLLAQASIDYGRRVFEESAVPSRDIPQHTLRWALKRSNTNYKQGNITAALQKDGSEMKRVHRLFEKFRSSVAGLEAIKTRRKSVTTVDRCIGNCCQVLHERFRTLSACGGWTNQALRYSWVVTDICGDYDDEYLGAIVTQLDGACAEFPYVPCLPI